MASLNSYSKELSRFWEGRCHLPGVPDPFGAGRGSVVGIGGVGGIAVQVKRAVC